MEVIQLKRLKELEEENSKIDDFNRECLLGKGSLTYPSVRVIRELEELIEIFGKPQSIRTDNGPEFISEQYRNWCDENNITRIYSNPGRPMENGYIERFNRTFREDVMDAYLFSSINQFNMIAEMFQELVLPAKIFLSVDHIVKKIGYHV